MSVFVKTHGATGCIASGNGWQQRLLSQQFVINKLNWNTFGKARRQPFFNLINFCIGQNCLLKQCLKTHWRYPECYWQTYWHRDIQAILFVISYHPSWVMLCFCWWVPGSANCVQYLKAFCFSWSMRSVQMFSMIVDSNVSPTFLPTLHCTQASR